MLALFERLPPSADLHTQGSAPSPLPSTTSLAYQISRSSNIIGSRLLYGFVGCPVALTFSFFHLSQHSAARQPGNIYYSPRTGRGLHSYPDTGLPLGAGLRRDSATSRRPYSHTRANQIKLGGERSRRSTTTLVSALTRTMDDTSDDERGRGDKSSVFSHSFSTTWRKALVSLPRIVPPSITSRYMGVEGPKPFVLKLPSSPPHDHSIPVHIFVQLPSTGDTPTASARASRARSANSSLRHSGRNTPTSAQAGSFLGAQGLSQSPMSSSRRSLDHTSPAPARPRSIHGSSDLAHSPAGSSRRSLDQRGPDESASSLYLSPAAAAARRSYENHQPTAPSTGPGPKPNQSQHRRPTLSLPVIIDFHGGSFILGSPSEQAPFCAYMCRALTAAHLNTGCVVISVDYRLGPYAKFPAANEDADDVIKAVLDPDGPAGRVLREDIRQHVEAMGRGRRGGSRAWVDLDTTRVAVSGFSSGGNLALNSVVDSPKDPNREGQDWPAAIPRDHRWPIPVLLFYPSFDARLLPDERPRPEGLDPPTGFFTRWKIEDQLMPKYLPVERRADVRASPGLASIKDDLHPKAKMLLVLPELDSLSDQSWKWVDRVGAEGRGEDLEVDHVKGEMHGWTQFPDSWIKSEESRKKKYDSFQRAADFVGRWWYGAPERTASVTFGSMDDKKS